MVLYRGKGTGGGLAKIKAMTHDVDVYRSANVMIDRHGDTAEALRAMRAEELLIAGDMKGRALWLRIAITIREL